MNVTFNFKNFDPSDHLRQYARRRFEKLSKYLDSADLQVNLTVEKFRHMAEVILTGDNIHINANEETEDMYSTIDLVLDKLDVQIRRLREKSKDRRKGGKDKSVRMDFFTYGQSETGERERVIVDSDKYEAKPMNVDEAAMQLESLQYEFLVFLNSESERVNVIYLRKNGDFGLIDPGM